RVPAASDGLHRTAARPRRVDRITGPVALRADRRAGAVLRAAGLLPGRHLDGGADDGRGPADRAGGRHRPAVVRHLRCAGGRDGTDHAAGRLQPVRAAGNDRAGTAMDRASDPADVRADGHRGTADLRVPGPRHLAAAADAGGGLNRGIVRRPTCAIVAPMPTLYPTAALRRLEGAALAALPPGTLMARAATAVADATARLARTLGPGRPVLALVGPGNNGGD